MDSSSFFARYSFVRSCVRFFFCEKTLNDDDDHDDVFELFSLFLFLSAPISFGVDFSFNARGMRS